MSVAHLTRRLEDEPHSIAEHHDDDGSERNHPGQEQKRDIERTGEIAYRTDRVGAEKSTDTTD